MTTYYPKIANRLALNCCYLRQKFDNRLSWTYKAVSGRWIFGPFFLIHTFHEVHIIDSSAIRFFFHFLIFLLAENAAFTWKRQNTNTTAQGSTAARRTSSPTPHLRPLLAACRLRCFTGLITSLFQRIEWFSVPSGEWPYWTYSILKIVEVLVNFYYLNANSGEIIQELYSYYTRPLCPMNKCNSNCICSLY
jgi:hypothetical protein